MFDQDAADTQHFEQVLVLAVRQLLDQPDPDVFIAWATARIPDFLGLADAGLDEDECRRLAHLLARAIWCATPRPDRRFRIVPLPDPPAAAPCPCGSGAAWAACCGAVAEVPELASELIWDILVTELNEEQLRRALDLKAIPRPLLARVAERWLDQDRPGRASALLEPLFAGDLAHLSAEFEPAMHLLCDAYERLAHHRKKTAFLHRICQEASRPLRAAAWQRRSTLALDEGDFASATAAFTEALRSAPDDPHTAVLEITLLGAQHQYALAAERARFWLHRLRRRGIDHPGILDFLERAVASPRQALLESQADALDPVLVDLQDWLAVVGARPIPHYGLVLRRPADPEQDPGQLGLFDDAASPAASAAPTTASPTASGMSADPQRQPPASGLRWMMPNPRPRHPSLPAELRPPRRVREIETLWRAVFPADKPRSTHLIWLDGTDIWADTDWSDRLLGHPEFADSLEVIDDLATALHAHPENALPWMTDALSRPLLERAWAILQRVLPESSHYQIPWSFRHNRAALRLLFRRYLFLVSESDLQGAAHTLETLLRLNPRDNHGIRAELMNHYLRHGEDERALDLARRFPNDLLADLAYGEVLALYRLGREERARLVLRTAVHRLPRIPHYLTRKRIKQPRLSPLGVSPGGEDQAWLYREAMRDVWEAEPGVLAWLKRLTA